MTLYRVVDKITGFFIRDDFSFDEDVEVGLICNPAQGFYKPKYNFETLLWVEGATEIPQLQKVNQKPTIEERVQLLEEVVLGGKK